jgi:hypothetical protein
LENGIKGNTISLITESSHIDFPMGYQGIIQFLKFILLHKLRIRTSSLKPLAVRVEAHSRMGIYPLWPKGFTTP